MDHQPHFKRHLVPADTQPDALLGDSAVTALYVIGAVVSLVAAWAIATFNTLVRARNRVDESWSGVDVQLKRRHDLVPNLVAAVEGYARHESGTLEAATQARAQARAAGAGGPASRGAVESALSGVLSQVRAVAERYPELAASNNFRQLQLQLAEVEDEIQGARNIFNSNVEFLNTKIQSFPNSLVAGLASFRERDFFEVDLPAERRPREVSFA